jgi:hypothetical protein
MEKTTNEQGRSNKSNKSTKNTAERNSQVINEQSKVEIKNLEEVKKAKSQTPRNEKFLPSEN